jgi:hypothetical protein
VPLLLCESRYQRARVCEKAQPALNYMFLQVQSIFTKYGSPVE